MIFDDILEEGKQRSKELSDIIKQLNYNVGFIVEDLNDKIRELEDLSDSVEDEYKRIALTLGLDYLIKNAEAKRMALLIFIDQQFSVSRKG